MTSELKFYKNDQSIAIFLNYGGLYVIFSFSLESTITPDDGSMIRFDTKDDACDWLNRNNYIHIPLNADARAQLPITKEREPWWCRPSIRRMEYKNGQHDNDVL